MVAIADDEGERRAERPSVAETGQHLDLVLLDLLARAATVALLPPAQVDVDRGLLNREPSRQPFDDRDERGPVRLPCRRQPEHATKRSRRFGSAQIRARVFRSGWRSA